MKTTIEIPDDLFRQAKAKAALEGRSLRDLLTYGLRLALQSTPASAQSRRADFPLIRSSGGAPVLTDADTSKALAELDEEEARRHAGSVRR